MNSYPHFIRRSPALSLLPFFSAYLLVQMSANRKQVENMAKKKLDNLMKESKIRDREDPDSFTITALPPAEKLRDKTSSKVNTDSKSCIANILSLYVLQPCGQWLCHIESLFLSMLQSKKCSSEY